MPCLQLVSLPALPMTSAWSLSPRLQQCATSVIFLQARLCYTHGLSGLESRQSSDHQQQCNISRDLSWITIWLQHCALMTTQSSVQKVQAGAKLGTVCWL